MAVQKKSISTRFPGGGSVAMKTTTRRGKRTYSVSTPAGTRSYTNRKAAYTHYRSLGGTGGGGAS